ILRDTFHGNVSFSVANKRERDVGLKWFQSRNAREFAVEPGNFFSEPGKFTCLKTSPHAPGPSVAMNLNRGTRPPFNVTPRNDNQGNVVRPLIPDHDFFALSHTLKKYS